MHKWIATLILLTFSIPTLAWGAEITCNLSNKELEVALDPTKNNIAISGIAPENSPVIIKVEGSKDTELVSMGSNNSRLIKFSEGEVHGLPGYYQILTSVSLEEIEKPHLLTLGLSPNYEELTPKAWLRIRQVDADENKLHLESDYIKLAIQQKLTKNLYGIRQGVVVREGNRYYANIPLIADMPLGELKVTALTITGNDIYQAPTQSVNIKSSSFLSVGFQELSVNPVLVISFFMIPILLMTAGRILELLEERKRLRQLKDIWR